MSEAIRIFIGTSADCDLEAEMVLDYTLHKYASQPLEITWMKLSRDPSSPFYFNPETGSGWQMKNCATPFSPFRWAIPSICDYEGKAIYFDVDFLVKANVAELWNQPFKPGKVVIARGGNRYCCSMWDCKAAALHIPTLTELQRDPSSHQKLQSYFGKHPELVQPFADGDWNALDMVIENVDAPNIRAIHFTSLELQPHYKLASARLALEGRAHWYKKRTPRQPLPALQALFDGAYQEAQAAGYVLSNYQ